MSCWFWGSEYIESISPNSLLLGVLNALKNGRLGAGWSGRVPGRLVSRFLSFVSQFFSFVSQDRCLWSGSRLACLPLPFICLPLLFICLPGWVLVVGFSHFLSFVSHFFSFVSQFFSFVSQFFSFVSQAGFFSFVSQAGFLWSGFRLACLPLPFICLPLLFICLPGWVLVVGFPAGLSPTSSHLSPTSFHLSPRLGACGRVPGWLVSHFLSFVSHFFSFVRLGACGRVCGWLVSPAGLSPTSFRLSPSSFHLSPRLGDCGRVPGWLVSHFLSFVSHFFSFVRLGACGRVGWLVSPAGLLFIVSQAGCLWSGSRPACLPLLFICLPGWVLVVGFPAGLSPTSFLSFVSCGRACLHFLSFVSHSFSGWVSGLVCLPLLFICLPGWVLVVGFPAGLSPTSLHLSPTFSPSSLLLGVLNSFLRCVRPLCHCWCPPISTGHVAFLFICLPGLSLLVSALFR